jgi:hypothetical protein
VGVYGVFVTELDEPERACLLAVWASRTHCHAATPQPHPRNFIPDRAASEQLWLAMELGRELTRPQLWRDGLLPSLGGPVGGWPLALCLVGLACLLAGMLGGRWLPFPSRYGLTFPAIFPPPLDAPGFLFAYWLLAVLPLFLPGLARSLRQRGRRGAPSCLEVCLKGAGGAAVEEVPVRGESAGLAFLAAAACAEGSALPWVQKLRDGNFAFSAALLSSGALRGVGKWPEKLDALARAGWKGTLVCALEDLGELSELHVRAFGRNIDLRRPLLRWLPGSGIERAPTGWGFLVVGCRDIWALARHLNHCLRRYLALRALLPVLPFLCALLPRPLAPQLDVHSSRLSCTLAAFDSCYYQLGAGEVDQLVIRLVGETVPAGHLELQVSASAAVLLTSMGEDPVKAVTFLDTEYVLLYVLMPAPAPPGGVVVGAAATNRAGKAASAWVWYSHAASGEE